MKPPPSSSLRERLNISRLALAHPRLTVAGWALVAVAGIVAYANLRLALFPDVTFPVVVVSANTSALSPEETEAAVALALERRIQGPRDLKSLQSTTSAGKTVIAAEFEVGIALRAARRRVDSALAVVGASPPTMCGSGSGVDFPLNGAPT